MAALRCRILESSMRVKRSSVASARQAAMPAEIQPLGLTDLRFVRDAIESFAPDWTAELAGICVDEATVVVVPESGDDASGPSFVISRDSFSYRLDRIHWDLMNEVGSFASLGDVMTAVRICVRKGEPASRALSLTLH